MKKLILILTGLILLAGMALGQSLTMVYDNFEGSKYHTFGGFDGYLDSTYVIYDTIKNSINQSSTCAMYIRKDSVPFATVVMNLKSSMACIENFTSTISQNKFSLKVYSSAPIGTDININIGKAGDDRYPEGVHSIYHAKTTTQNEWELINFIYVDKVIGSQVMDSEIDKVVLLFGPQTLRADTFLFDDVTGPMLPEFVNISEIVKKELFVLKQNAPNPASQITKIEFMLEKPGDASLKIFNVVGQEVINVRNGFHQAGIYTSAVNISELERGVYFYVLKTAVGEQVKKMVVSR
jgi:hypothetical protein